MMPVAATPDLFGDNDGRWQADRPSLDKHIDIAADPPGCWKMQKRDRFSYVTSQGFRLDPCCSLDDLVQRSAVSGVHVCPVKAVADTPAQFIVD